MTAPLHQSYTKYPLTSLLASSGHVRVLRALLAHGGALGAKQLANDAGLTPPGVRRVLDSLSSQGVVNVMGQPRSQVFAFAETHPFAAHLKALFGFERSHWEAFNDALRSTINRHKQARSAWLYGSVSRGNDTQSSDVDIAIVIEGADSDVAILREELLELSEKFNVSLSPIILTEGDVAQQPTDSTWWMSVVRDAKVLKGDTPKKELARCTKKELNV